MTRSSSDFRWQKWYWCRRIADARQISKRRWSTWRNTWRRPISSPSLTTWCCSLLAVGCVSSCGTIQPTQASGRFITTQHGTARFNDAYQGARDYCAKLGLDVRHLGTDTPLQSISRFECIAVR